MKRTRSVARISSLSSMHIKYLHTFFVYSLPPTIIYSLDSACWRTFSIMRPVFVWAYQIFHLPRLKPLCLSPLYKIGTLIFSVEWNKIRTIGNNVKDKNNYVCQEGGKYTFRYERCYNSKLY